MMQMSDTERILSVLSEMQKDINGLKKDFVEMRQDVNGLKADMNAMKADVNGLKADMNEMRQDMNVMKQEMKGLRRDVDGLKSQVDENTKILGAVVKRLEMVDAKIDGLAITTASTKAVQDLRVSIGEHFMRMGQELAGSA